MEPSPVRDDTAEGRVKRLSSQPPHNSLKHPPPLLIILKLIEAGARRRQQHHITRLRHGIRLAESILQRLRMNDFYVPVFRRNDLRLDLPRRRADRIYPLHSLPQQFVEHAVIAAFILTAENEVDVRGERLQRSEERIHVRSLRI